jgi:hypothetical protein
MSEMLEALVRQEFERRIASGELRGPRGDQGEPGRLASTDTQWKASDIGFFDPGLPDKDGSGMEVLNYITYYTSVYTFIDRMIDLVALKSEDVVKANIHSCLKASALRWYTHELTHFEKELMSQVPLESGWFKSLRDRFKPNREDAKLKLERLTYGWSDVRSGRTPRDFAQAMIIQLKALGRTTTFDWISEIREHIDASLARDLPRPTEEMQLSTFMNDLDFHYRDWQRQATKSRASEEQRQKAHQAYQANTPQALRDSPRFFQPRPRQAYAQQFPQQQFTQQQFPQQGQGYTQRQGQFQQQHRPQFPPRSPYQQQGQQRQALPQQQEDKKQLMISDKPYYNSLGPRQSYKQPWNRPQNARATAYHANQSDSISQFEDQAYFADSASSFQSQSQSTPFESHQAQSSFSYAPPNAYYSDAPYAADFPSHPELNDVDNPNAYNEEIEEDLQQDRFEPTAQMCAPEPAVTCLHCQVAFPSGNKLHEHLLSCTPAAAAPISQDAVANFADPSLQIFESTRKSDYQPGYTFRSWRYATAPVALTDPDKIITCCLDSGCVMTLIDAKLAESLTCERRRVSPILVSGIGSRHMSSFYIRIPIFFKADNGRAKLTIEAHLVDNLKAQLLIGMDVLGPEGFTLDFSRCQASIGSCKDFTFPIAIAAKPNHVAARPVYADGTITIQPGQSAAIPVCVKTKLPTDREYIFDPAHTKLDMLAQITDTNFAQVDVFNSTSVPQRIRRKDRIGTLFEGDFTSAYAITPDAAALCLQPREHRYDKDRPRPQLVEELATMSADTHITLPNGVTVYGDSDTIVKLKAAVEAYDIWSKSSGTVKIPQEQWMKLPILPGAKFPRAQVYRQGPDGQAAIDEVFDQLHNEGKMSWSKNHTPSAHPVFVVWKTITMPDGTEIRKSRPVVDFRGSNKLQEPDLYPLPTQDEIIQLARNKRYISVVDAAKFFYQWRVHPDHVDRQAVVTHRGQELIHVVLMGNSNSVAYVQRQIDNILRPFRAWCRAYVDDIVIVADTLHEHIQRLHLVFAKLQEYGISLDPAKARIGFPSLTLLGKDVDSFGMTTKQEKLRAITSLEFPRTCKQLETYLGMTGHLRHYIDKYAAKAAPLQRRKTNLLKGCPSDGPSRKSWSLQTLLREPSNEEIDAFTKLQAEFADPRWLVHFDRDRQLYCDIDASKESGFGAMLYHLDSNYHHADVTIPPPSTKLQPISFYSRELSNAQRNYWITELEVACLVWILKKTRHMVEAAPIEKPPIFYTDHSATVGIGNATKLRSEAVEKQNLRLVRASQYVQQFRVRLIHRPGKSNLVADALSRLPSTNPSKPQPHDDDLDDIDAPYAFTTSIIEISEDFKKRIIDGYQSDPRLRTVIDTLRKVDEDSDPIKAKLPYHIDSRSLLFLTNSIGEPSLCLPRSLTKEIFKLVHDDQAHQGFNTAWQKLRGITFYKGAKLLKQYIRHCPQCNEQAVPRHQPYGSLQPILSPPIPFHTITLDFITGLPHAPNSDDAALLMTDKFTKLLGAISGRTDWSGEQWAKRVLDYWFTANWGLPTVIISDRDVKFVQGFWRELFSALHVKLLYSTAYHPQTDGQSERSNQTFEIALRHWVVTYNAEHWPISLPYLCMVLNSSVKESTGYTPHQLLYGIELRCPWDLFYQAPLSRDADFTARADAETSLAFAAVSMKKYYDDKHLPKHFDVGDHVYIKLGHGFNIPTNDPLPSKLQQRFAGPYKVLARVGRLAYKLDIPANRRVHPVISIAHLEHSPHGNDPWDRQPDDLHQPTYDPRYPTDDDRYDVEKILAKRTRPARGRPRKDGIRKLVTQYLIRWAGQSAKEDQWVNEEHTVGAEELIKEFEALQTDESNA